MKKIIKKALAIILTIVMISSTFVCFAAELNNEAVEMHKGQFKNYLLLGDSAASGYRDQITSDDRNFNYDNYETVYHVVPGSYADIIGKSIIGEGGKTSSFAAPGFRTIEVRYMLNDEYAQEVKDEPYLFHPSQLYVYEDDKVYPGDNQFHLPGDDYFRAEYKKAVAEADLITLGVGGNDWGAYLTWVFADVLEETNVADEYIQMAKEVLEKSTMDMDTVAQIVEIAHMAGAIESILKKVPAALEYGLTTFYKNWNAMIEDIYSYNDDVTLMVVGMSDNSVKGNYFSYNGVEGGPVNTEEVPADDPKAAAMKYIVGAIMAIANEPMINGAKKYGYTYVNTDGTTYVDSHPDAAGHMFIANKIIEALPNPAVSKQYNDIAGHKYYNAIEYVLLNNIMKPLTDTTFGPDSLLKSSELTAALNAIKGTDKTSDGDKSVSSIKMAIEILGCASFKNFAGFFKTVALSLSVISDANFNLNSSVTRGQAANYLRTLNQI